MRSNILRKPAVQAGTVPATQPIRAPRQLSFELIVRCKIDHRDSLAIPECLCRACHPELNDPAPARAIAPIAEARTDWPFSGTWRCTQGDD